MKATCITATCENGHRQQLKIDDSLGVDWAINLAGLLDGSSPMYLFPPGPDSVIGKCGICGKQIACTITDPDPLDRR